MMFSSITSNGLSDMASRSPASLLDDSEESFVVLSNSVDEITGQMTSLSAGSSVDYPTLQEIPKTNTENIIEKVSSTTMMMMSQESNLSCTSELSAEEIQQKMGNLLRENCELKETLKQNNLAIKQQYDALAKWQEDVVKVQESHKIKFEETKKLVLNLKTENAELKKATNSSYDSSKDHVDLKSKISALEFELDTLRLANTKQNMDQTKIIQEYELKLSECTKINLEESMKYKNQIESLVSQLNDVEVAYNKVKEELIEIKSKLPTDIEKANTETIKEQLKELAQEVILKNTMLKEKTDLIDNLHEMISKLKIENECIPILKTQVDVYQTDFNQEREARETLKAEKDHIAGDLQILQRRNHKLLEQIEQMERKSIGNVPRVPSSSSPSRSTPSREEQTIFECPKCQFAFYNYQALENHVYRCLESND